VKRIRSDKITTAGACAAWIALALAGGQNMSRAQDVSPGNVPPQSSAIHYSGQASHGRL